nr:unnamed protein product [Homo sapiens]
MMAPKPGLDFSPFDFAHFGFPSDNSGKERSFQAKPSPKLGRHVYSRPKVDIQKICIGNKNIFTVSDLKPDTQYYFDVFVVNINSNMSTAYVGTFARTKEEAKQKTVELKDGKITDVFVKRKGAKFLQVCSSLFSPKSHLLYSLLSGCCPNPSEKRWETSSVSECGRHSAVSA